MNLDELRTVRARTFALIEGLSQEQLDYVPAPGAWSVGEQVDHLILAEQVLRGDMAILIERAKAIQVGNGLHEGVTMGPAVSKQQLAGDLEYVDIATGEGARVLYGGQRLLLCSPPTRHASYP